MAKKGHIKIDALANSIGEILDKYGIVCKEIVKSAAYDTLDEIRDDVASRAPENTGGYKASIEVKYNVHKRRDSSYGYVWGGREGYPLAHLLEHGHATRRGTRTKAIEHWAPAEAAGNQKFIDNLTRKLKEATGE